MYQLFHLSTLIAVGYCGNVRHRNDGAPVLASSTAPLPGGGGAGVIQDRAGFPADRRSAYWDDQVFQPDLIVPSPSPPPHSPPPPPSPSPPPAPAPAPAPAPTPESTAKEEAKVNQMLQTLTKRVNGASSDEAKNAAEEAEMPLEENEEEGPEPGTPAADAMTTLGKMMAQSDATMVCPFIVLLC